MFAQCGQTALQKNFWSDGRNETRYSGVWNHVLTEKHGCGCDCIVYAIFEIPCAWGEAQIDRIDVMLKMLWLSCARAFHNGTWLFLLEEICCSFEVKKRK